MKKIKKEVEYGLLKFFIPIVIGVGGSAVFLLLLPYQISSKLLPLMLAYFFPPMGKESVIPIGIGSGIPPHIMIFAISFMDIITGLFMVWNYDNVKYIPLIGKPLNHLLKKAERKGKEVSKEHRWIKSLEFVGVSIFIIIPFQGTGAISASIVGRIIGMDPWRVWFATIIGSLISCTLMAYGSELVKVIIGINPILAVVFVLGIIYGILLFIEALKKNFKN